MSESQKQTEVAGSPEKPRRIMEDGRRHQTQGAKARADLWIYIKNEFEVLLLESELDEIVRLASAIRDAAPALPPNAPGEPRRTDA